MHTAAAAEVAAGGPQPPRLRHRCHHCHVLSRSLIWAVNCCTNSSSGLGTLREIVDCLDGPCRYHSMSRQTGSVVLMQPAFHAE